MIKSSKRLQVSYESHDLPLFLYRGCTTEKPDTVMSQLRQQTLTQCQLTRNDMAIDAGLCAVV